MDSTLTVLETDQTSAEIPYEVHMLCSALETGQHAKGDRRARIRRSYRAPARLRLFSDLGDSDPTRLYTRDVDPRGVGFLTQRRLPLGYGGVIEIPAPDGQKLKVHGTLIRCRLAAPGWYEGCFSFNRQQADFME